MDRSVSNASDGAPLHPTAGLIGITTLANVDQLAIGATLDGRPAIFGNGRLGLAGLAGWQPRIGDLRLQILGEAGAHRFSEVGAGLFSQPMDGPTWLPYGGARLGAARSFGERGYVDAGVWLFARYDFGRKTVTTIESTLFGPSTPTDYNLGGYMAGLALQVGFRLETPRARPASLASR